MGHSSTADAYDPDLQMRMIDQRRVGSGVQEILDAAFTVVCCRIPGIEYEEDIPKLACKWCNVQQLGSRACMALKTMVGYAGTA